MVQSKPSSPRHDLAYGFQHLIVHNAGGPFSNAGSDVSLFSQPRSTFNSPAISKQSLQGCNVPPVPFSSPHIVDQQSLEGYGIGFHYTHASEFPEPHLDTCNSYPEPPMASPIRPDHIPLTPKSSESDTIKTRSSRNTRSASPYVRPSESNESTRSSKSSKTKKQKANKGTTTAPKIDKPLSILTKDMTDVPIRDMEAWVNRSTEERMREVEKKNGHVVRPMNSFMLYRAAYQHRTKAWCAQNNHQVVSTVSGESWPLEPESVRDFYNELARIERVNHAKAHPTYKFSPSKAGLKNKKKSGTWGSDEDEDEEGEFSPTEDPDMEWRPRSERRATKLARRYQDRMQPMHDNSVAHELPSFDIDASGFPSSNWVGDAVSRPMSSGYGYEMNNPYQQTPLFSPPMPMQPHHPVHHHQQSHFHQLQRQPNFYIPPNVSSEYHPDMSMSATHAHMGQHNFGSSGSLPHQLPQLSDGLSDSTFEPDAAGMFPMQVDPGLIPFDAAHMSDVSGAGHVSMHGDHMFDDHFDDWMRPHHPSGNR